MGEGLEADVSIGLRWCGVAVWAGLWVGVAGAQAPVPALSGTDSSATLSAMAGQAAVIFAGHVIAVARHDEAGFVQVTFAIDEAILGCGAAAIYDLREWAGLWTGAPRYRAGQRLLMLLHAPGTSGFSSPIHGMDGAIPLIGAGAPALMDTGGAVTADAGSGGLSADLGWVQARALRGAQAQTTGLVKRSTAVGRPIASPSAGLSLGDGTVVSLSDLLNGLRGVVGGSR